MAAAVYTINKRLILC